MCGIGNSAIYLCPKSICDSKLIVNFPYYVFNLIPNNYTLLNNDFSLPNTNCQCGGAGYIGQTVCAKTTDICELRNKNFYQCVPNTWPVGNIYVTSEIF